MLNSLAKVHYKSKLNVIRLALTLNTEQSQKPCVERHPPISIINR